MSVVGEFAYVIFYIDLHSGSAKRSFANATFQKKPRTG